MLVSLKDTFKLLGIIVVSACAVFVCTFFLNFYLDASVLREVVPQELLELYEAQMTMSKLTCVITGGCLGIVSVILLLFYVKIYIESHAKQLGILKALGYSDGKISLGFWIFGFAVLAGTAIGFCGGFAIMPLIYRQMGEGIPDLAIHFHAELLLTLVILPAIVFSALSILFTRLKLRRSALSLLKDTEAVGKVGKFKKENDRPFLTELRRETVKSKKSLAFFVAFACFCFSSLIQMSLSMKKYSSVTMGAIIFGIGVVLALTAFLLAFSSLTSANAKTAAVMKANGYTQRQCGETIFGGYRLLAYIGFAVGTLYQHALLKIMIETLFEGLTDPYRFNVVGFFVVLAVFAVLLEIAICYFTHKIGKHTIRETITE